MGVPVLNMTSFFNRELFLYSLGDISLSKPVSLKKAGFFLGGIIVWGIPLLMIFGLRLDVFFLMIVIGPPAAIAYISDKPLFDGRGIFDATRVTFKFIFSKRCYTDFNVSNTHTNPEYFIDKEIWISRRRELHELANLWEERSNS